MVIVPVPLIPLLPGLDKSSKPPATEPRDSLF